MKRAVFTVLLFVLGIFIVPSLLHLALWQFQDRPKRWNQANWRSAGILPRVPALDEAGVWLMSASTGGMKGAFADHSWIVLKKPGTRRYERYDVVGWGPPLRRNGYDADARWFSNPPRIVSHVEGDAARRILHKVEQAIADYRWSNRGDYGIWPGPNSNTFTAAIVRAVPEWDAAVPPRGVGRDFPEDGRWFGRTAAGTWFATLGGYAGLRVGPNHGLELNFLGLVAGLDPLRRAVKVPSFGEFRL